VIHYIDILSIIISFVFLIYGSFSDIKTRQVSNAVWIAFLPIAIVLTLLRIVLYPDLLMISLISIIIITIISIVIFYGGIIGGADSKAIICLGVAMPIYPFFFKEFYHPFFPISVFINSYVISCGIFLYAFIRNLKWLLREKEGLYSGLEKESYWKKILAFISGYKIDLSDYNNSRLHYFPLEIIRFENGVKQKNFKFFLRIESEENKPLNNNMKNSETFKSKRIWATPMLPMLLFIALGYLLTLITGDIILRLVSVMFGFF
jgi:prepilin signal peptidase PulO-like enzyme (type II secretory pathway)